MGTDIRIGISIKKDKEKDHEKDHSKMVHRYEKDRRKKNDWRKQTVVPLIAYKSEEKQDIICLLKDGERVYVEEFYTDTDDYIQLLVDGEEIGRLPKKYEKLALEEEGIHSAYIESIEIDDNDKYRPYIRIYWIKDGRPPRPEPKYNLVDARTIKPSTSDFDKNHPLYGKNIIITGALSIPRKEAMQKAADAGAILKNDISQKIDYLIVGEKDPQFCDDAGMSKKERKAKELTDKGKGHIKIISDEEFMALLLWNPEE